MSKEEDQLKNNIKTVECCVKNCGVKIPIDDAMEINGNYFCKICGTAFIRTNLGI